MYAIKCEKCAAEIEFEIEQVPELESAMSANEAEAAAQERRTCESEFKDHVDADEIMAGRRLIDLAIAIRRGDRAEAEHQLDRIADMLGVKATEHVQQGRFSARARVPA